ncbi:hypothetical protein GW846_05670 [Candidatus Gracilibacteria bacterium]|nr:hypothetical protein [Candidatus Gracilibacteria bacterium]
MPKVIAGIALLALFGGILGTGLLVLANMASQNSAPEISQDELQDFLNTLSGSASTGSEIDTQNGDTPSQSGTSSN